MKELMNKIYGKFDDYGSAAASGVGKKLPFISSHFSGIEGKILDAGCGQGHDTREIAKTNSNVLGIEISDVCCDKYLDDVNHKCTDIITHCAGDVEYEAVLCNGVIEHLSEDELDDVLKALGSVSTNVLFGIANHSDTFYGPELHLIQEDVAWWIKRLETIFDSAIEVTTLYEGRFFFIKCINSPAKLKSAAANRITGLKGAESEDESKKAKPRVRPKKD